MKVLLAGENWVTYQFHIKGLAGFAAGGYGEGASHLVRYAADAGHHVDHLPNEHVSAGFPRDKVAQEDTRDARGQAGTGRGTAQLG